MTTRLDIARKKMARWRVLRILYIGRPLPTGEGLIAEVMDDADLQMTMNEIRNALQYLCDKQFVEVNQIKNDDGLHWEARLLPPGVDFVEYNTPDHDGIARPEQ